MVIQVFFKHLTRAEGKTIPQKEKERRKKRKVICVQNDPLFN